MTRKQIAIGLRAMKGGAVTVAVSLAQDPHVILSQFLSTAAEGDRLALEPFAVAYEIAQKTGTTSSQAEAAVTEGCARQRTTAVQHLENVLSKLRDDDWEIGGIVLLTNRAGWVSDLLYYSLGSPDHPAVAEGLAVREALRFASSECGVDLTEVDEKSLPETAAQAFALSPQDLGATLKQLGAGLKPWRKEQKSACLAAWVRLAQSTSAGNP